MARNEVLFPIRNGRITNTWKILKLLQTKSYPRSIIKAQFEGNVAEHALGRLAEAGLIVSQNRLWSLTEKGTNHIAKWEAVAGGTEIQKEQRLFGDAPMMPPVLAGRRTKYWDALQALVENPAGLYLKTKSPLYSGMRIMFHKGFVDIDPVSRVYTLNDKGREYLSKFSTYVKTESDPVLASLLDYSNTYVPPVTKSTSPVETSNLAPMGNPAGKVYVTYKEATFTFDSVSAANEFAKGL